MTDTPKKTVRIDKLLAREGYSSSREKAKREIMAGNVYVDDQLVDKPGTRVNSDSEIDIRRPGPRYASRGGVKLEKALEAFNVVPKGKSAIDVGASTGGFTDCLLRSGAKSVCALDVGKGQLDWNLRNDERVEVREGVNARYITPQDFDRKFDLGTIDVSFISLELIIPPVSEVITSEGLLVVLVKPQFEAGPDKVERGGVVSDPQVHAEVLRAVASVGQKNGLPLVDSIYSPITGKASNNIEYFLYFDRNKNPRSIDFPSLVREAQSNLT